MMHDFCKMWIGAGVKTCLYSSTSQMNEIVDKLSFLLPQEMLSKPHLIKSYEESRQEMSIKTSNNKTITLDWGGLGVFDLLFEAVSFYCNSSFSILLSGSPCCQVW